MKTLTRSGVAPENCTMNDIDGEPRLVEIAFIHSPPLVIKDSYVLAPWLGTDTSI